MLYQIPLCWPGNSSVNQAICFTTGGRLPFFSFSTSVTPALTVLSLDANQCLPRWIYVEGIKTDNLTDWGLTQFQNHYEKGLSKQKRLITKEDIFHYVYAVLHDPVYREQYALNLRREFPRLPFYADFWPWAGWGEKLMDLHIGYETVEPWPLQRLDVPDANFYIEIRLGS